MLALVFEAERRIALREDQPRPAVLKPTDAVVRVSLCAICGSDLHPFRGDERGIQPGTVVGHEVRPRAPPSMLCVSYVCGDGCSYPLSAEQLKTGAAQCVLPDARTNPLPLPLDAARPITLIPAP